MAMMNEMEYRTIGKVLAGGYRAAVYCRLSKDDDLQGESAEPIVLYSISFIIAIYPHNPDGIWLF